MKIHFVKEIKIKKDSVSWHELPFRFMQFLYLNDN